PRMRHRLEQLPRRCAFTNQLLDALPLPTRPTRHNTTSRLIELDQPGRCVDPLTPPLIRGKPEYADPSRMRARNNTGSTRRDATTAMVAMHGLEEWAQRSDTRCPLSPGETL